MKILNNELLSKHTTIHLGGTSKEYIIPESVDELLNVIREKNPEYFIGGGSNLLIADHEFESVVDLRSFDQTIEAQGEGTFKAGASVRLQKLINTVNENGYGGIEYLYSVPGLVGGAVVMNAGRGKQFHKTISDYIISVDVIRDGNIVTVSKEQCGFEHRNSVFKDSKDIVISVLFRFPEMEIEESERLKKERIDLCKEKQDNSKPNFGSVFIESNGRIMDYARKHRLGNQKVHFSGKTANWILNDNGTFDDAVAAIKKVEKLHKLFFRECKREVIIWE